MKIRLLPNSVGWCLNQTRYNGVKALAQYLPRGKHSVMLAVMMVMIFSALQQGNLCRGEKDLSLFCSLL